MYRTYLCVVINSYNSCMIHGDCRVLTTLVFRSVTNKLLYLFHNALDHNDSSALPGHFTRTIPYAIMSAYNIFANSDSQDCEDNKLIMSNHCQPISACCSRPRIIMHLTGDDIFYETATKSPIFNGSVPLVKHTSGPSSLRIHCYCLSQSHVY